MSIKAKLRSRAIYDKLSLKALDKINSLENELDIAYRLGGEHMIDLLENGYGFDFTPDGLAASIKKQLEYGYEPTK